MQITTKISNSIMRNIVKHIELDEAILICSLKAEQENNTALANKLRSLSNKEENI